MRIPSAMVLHLPTGIPGRPLSLCLLALFCHLVSASNAFELYLSCNNVDTPVHEKDLAKVVSTTVHALDTRIGETPCRPTGGHSLFHSLLP
jgi:hypothetical protein